MIEKDEKTTLEELDEELAKRKATDKKSKMMKWLKKKDHYREYLTAKNIVNMFLNEEKKKEEIKSLDAIKGILLGTCDRRFGSGDVKKVCADVLTTDMTIMRTQWWGTLPRPALKKYSKVPLLKSCLFRGGMEDYKSKKGDVYTHFDVKDIEVLENEPVNFDDLTLPNPFNEENPEEFFDQVINDVESKSKVMIGFDAKIKHIMPFKFKSWDDGNMSFGPPHPVLFDNCFTLTFLLYVSPEFKITVSFPPQRLGIAPFLIDNYQGIKNVLAKMHIGKDVTEKEAERILYEQRDVIENILLNKKIRVVGEAYVKEVDDIGSDVDYKITIDAPSIISIMDLPEGEFIEQDRELDEEDMDESEVEKYYREEIASERPEEPTLKAGERIEIINNKEAIITRPEESKAKPLPDDEDFVEKDAPKLVAKKKKKGKSKATKKVKFDSKKVKEEYKNILTILEKTAHNEGKEPYPSEGIDNDILDVLISDGVVYEPMIGSILILGKLKTNTKNTIMTMLEEKHTFAVDKKIEDPKPAEEVFTDLELKAVEILSSLKALLPNADPSHLVDALNAQDITLSTDRIMQLWQKI